jgi:hypothetical protein
MLIINLILFGLSGFDLGHTDGLGTIMAAGVVLA